MVDAVDMFDNAEQLLADLKVTLGNYTLADILLSSDSQGRKAERLEAVFKELGQSRTNTVNIQCAIWKQAQLIAKATAGKNKKQAS
jgi:hypothetical protein